MAQGYRRALLLATHLVSPMPAAQVWMDPSEAPQDSQSVIEEVTPQDSVCEGFGSLGSLLLEDVARAHPCQPMP